MFALPVISITCKSTFHLHVLLSITLSDLSLHIGLSVRHHNYDLSYISASPTVTGASSLPLSEEPLGAVFPSVQYFHFTIISYLSPLSEPPWLISLLVTMPPPFPPWPCWQWLPRLSILSPFLCLRQLDPTDHSILEIHSFTLLL